MPDTLAYLEAALMESQKAAKDYREKTLDPAQAYYNELKATADSAKKTYEAFIRAQERKADKARLHNFLTKDIKAPGLTVMELIERGGGEIDDYDYISSTGMDIARVTVTFEVTQAMLDATGIRWSSKGNNEITATVNTYDDARKLYDMGAKLKDSWSRHPEDTVGAYYEKTHRHLRLPPKNIYATPKKPKAPEPEPDPRIGKPFGV